jgi:23S rRNA-/tRNA-specific pseudouridylate synthase
VSERTEYAELAKLEYNVLPHGNNYLWEIKLYTGKYHQIRVQLANIGCPIIGDVMYGSEIPYLPNAIALHAHKLVITHPVTLNKITFESSLNFVNN